MEIEGKVALVTGAGAGIGQAIALRLGHEGAVVVVADVDADAGRETAGQIEAAGGRAAMVRADLAVEAGVRAMVAFAGEQFGGLDILVNNAGIAPPPYFPEAEPAHWGRTLDVNLRGLMLATQLACRMMAGRGGGLVVNIASMAGVGHWPYGAPEYAATKAAVVRLTTALGGLKEEMGVRVNCICPGWVATASVQAYLDKADPEETAAQPYPPPVVLIQPSAIAEAVLMFARNEELAGQVMVWPDDEPWRLEPGLEP